MNLQTQLEHIKVCVICKQAKSIHDFFKSKREKDGLSRDCKDCNMKRAKEWNARHPERRKATRRKNYEENKEKYLQISTEWNREHSDKHVESNRKWRENNPEKYAALSHKHSIIKKDRKIKAGEIPTTEEIRELIISSKKKCFWCGKTVKDKELNIDHLYPLAKGGTNHISNLVVSCGLCNRRKHAKDPERFLEEVISANI